MGCRQSQRHVLERAIADGMESLLVLEDDLCFVNGFREKVEVFLDNVPPAVAGTEELAGGTRTLSPTLKSPYEKSCSAYLCFC